MVKSKCITVLGRAHRVAAAARDYIGQPGLEPPARGAMYYSMVSAQMANAGQCSRARTALQLALSELRVAKLAAVAWGEDDD